MVDVGYEPPSSVADDARYSLETRLKSNQFLAGAGRYLGFGRAWESTDLVKRYPTLR